MMPTSCEEAGLVMYTQKSLLNEAYETSLPTHSAVAGAKARRIDAVPATKVQAL